MVNKYIGVCQVFTSVFTYIMASLPNKCSRQHMLTKVPGTVDFMPPEAFARSPVYGVGIDMFSYGGIMLFMATHKWLTVEPLEFDPVTNKLLVLHSEVERRQEYLDEMTGDLK